MRHESYASLDELVTPETLSRLAECPIGTTRRLPFSGGYSASGSRFFAIETSDGRGPRFVVKQLSLEWDWIMRATGDDRGREALAWTTGLLDRLPTEITHPTLGCARDGAGWAILMRNVSDTLYPPCDDYLPPVEPADHRCFLDAMAALHAAFWDESQIADTAQGFCSPWHRYRAFSSEVGQLEEAAPDVVPRCIRDGWNLLPTLVDPALAELVIGLANDPSPLCAALARYPQTAVHGDLRTANLGLLRNGEGEPRAMLLDWHFVGPGTPGVDLTWYLRETVGPDNGIARETLIQCYRDRLAHRLGSRFDEAWWQPQLELSLLGQMLRSAWDMVWATLSHERASVRDRGREDLIWWGERALAATRWL